MIELWRIVNRVLFDVNPPGIIANEYRYSGTLDKNGYMKFFIENISQWFIIHMFESIADDYFTRTCERYDSHGTSEFLGRFRIFNFFVSENN